MVTTTLDPGSLAASRFMVLIVYLLIAIRVSLMQVTEHFLDSAVVLMKQDKLCRVSASSATPG